MAKEEKSVIEQALLEAQQIDETFQATAKEILAQTMGSEIEEMVKESLEGSEVVTEDEDDDLDLATDLDMGAGDELDLGDEGDMDDLDLDLGDDMDDEEEMDVVDLTDADDSELISVFKKMGADDEIEVVQDEDGVSFTDLETGAEYKVELGGDSDDSELGDLEAYGDDDEEEVIDLEAGDELEIEDEDDMDLEESEVVYEIEITEDEDEEDEDENEEEMEEGREPKTLGKAAKLPNRKSSDIGDNRRKMRGESKIPSIDKKLVKENKVLKHKLNGLATENEELKENHEKMVGALKQFRQKLQEVAVFNSNLAHVVRLFTENTTTKEEKVEIVKRMDEAKDLKESKMMFKTIAKELEGTKTTKTIQESVEDKVNKTASTGASQITESKVYVHPELEKMKKMWEFNYKY
jgi:hypothetical protein